MSANGLHIVATNSGTKDIYIYDYVTPNYVAVPSFTTMNVITRLAISPDGVYIVFS